MGLKIHLKYAVLLFVAMGWAGCNDDTSEMAIKTMEVTVTAYNSVPWQTTAVDSDIAAWGDTLKPGMQCIAVSRDLMYLGLTRGAKVQIQGLEGEFEVLDKMNKRYKRRIDIYMGLDVAAAREWGRQKRAITWMVEKEGKFDKRYQYVPVDSLEKS
jgi:3D (Asp-Asp-Asp) domain-containing protein